MQDKKEEKLKTLMRKPTAKSFQMQQNKSILGETNPIEEKSAKEEEDEDDDDIEQKKK